MDFYDASHILYPLHQIPERPLDPPDPYDWGPHVEKCYQSQKSALQKLYLEQHEEEVDEWCRDTFNDERGDNDLSYDTCREGL